MNFGTARRKGLSTRSNHCLILGSTTCTCIIRRRNRVTYVNTSWIKYVSGYIGKRGRIILSGCINYARILGIRDSAEVFDSEVHRFNVLSLSSVWVSMAGWVLKYVDTIVYKTARPQICSRMLFNLAARIVFGCFHNVAWIAVQRM